MTEILLGWLLLAVIPAAIADARRLPVGTWFLYGLILAKPRITVASAQINPREAILSVAVLRAGCPAEGPRRASLPP
jgi:hypothetical protein